MVGKKKSADAVAAERWQVKHQPHQPFTSKRAFLAGLKRERRGCVAAVRKLRTYALGGGASFALTDAIEAIQKRGRK